MKISRTALLALLKSLEPAIASESNELESLSCIWFDGRYVSAYDDILGIRASLETDFSGGVNGKKLLGILDKSRAKEVTLEKDENDNLLLKAGSARIKFALKPIEEWFWKPKIPELKAYEVEGEFLQAVESVLFSVGTGKIQTPEQKGVTIIQNGSSADLFTTDAVSLSWVNLQGSISEIERVILPTPFCLQLKKIAGPGFGLWIDQNSVYCVGTTFVEGFKTEFLLFSRLVEDESPVDFKERVEDYTQEKRCFVVPNRLSISLDRALVLLAGGEPAELELEKDCLYLYAQPESKLGEIDDAVKIEGESNHPDIKANIDPALVKRGMEGRETMTITQDCIIFRGPGNFVHIVGNK